MPDALSTAIAALDAQADGLAKAFREAPDAVRRAVEAAAPAALASLIGRGESDEGAADLLAALQDPQAGPELLTTLGTRLDGVRLRGRAGGSGIRLLGGRGQALVEQLGPFAGLKPSSASAVVDLVTPVLLASLRRNGAAPSNAEELRRLLRREAEPVNRALPDAFQPRFSITLVPESPTSVAPGRAGLPAAVWWVLAIVAIIAIAVVIWLSSGHAHAEVATPSVRAGPLVAKAAPQHLACAIELPPRSAVVVASSSKVTRV